MNKYPLPTDQFKGRQTPFYYYDLRLLDDTLKLVRDTSGCGQFKVHYAVKACVDRPVIERIAAAGFGADVVSGGELKTALAAGFPAEKIVLAGVGKSDSEIEAGLKAGIGCFNAESVEELEVIADIAGRLSTKARIALRVNPEIDAHTHHYITTGVAENKFGIAMSMLDAAVAYCQNSEWLELTGLHFHIGSQITDLTPYETLCDRINELTAWYRSQGVTFKTINVGGGLGIDYDDPDGHPFAPFADYFKIFRDKLNISEDQEVHFELGRAIVAQCGSLISKVLYVKTGVAKKFVIVDAGMSDLIRPALYQAHHEVQNLTSEDAEKERYDVVGPICESSDVFASNIELPKTRRGDLIAFRSAGAYGRVMASQYNCRTLPDVFAH